MYNSLIWIHCLSITFSQWITKCHLWIAIPVLLQYYFPFYLTFPFHKKEVEKKTWKYTLWIIHFRCLLELCSLGNLIYLGFQNFFVTSEVEACLFTICLKVQPVERYQVYLCQFVWYIYWPVSTKYYSISKFCIKVLIETEFHVI